MPGRSSARLLVDDTQHQHGFVARDHLDANSPSAPPGRTARRWRPASAAAASAPPSSVQPAVLVSTCQRCMHSDGCRRSPASCAQSKAEVFPRHACSSSLAWPRRATKSRAAAPSASPRISSSVCGMSEVAAAPAAAASPLGSRSTGDCAIGWAAALQRMQRC